MENVIPNPYQVNLTKDALIILETVEKLAGKFGMNYLISILRGQDKFGLKDQEHAGLATFGEMSELSYEEVRNRLNYLENQDFIKIKDARYGTLINATKGVSFIEKPQELWVKKRELRTSEEEKIIRQELRQIRKELAAETGKPPFRIFTDYTLGLLAREKPVNAAELILIPGFGNYKSNRYGPAIFKALERANSQWEENRILQAYQRAKTPSHQSVKALFEAGNSVEEIASERAVKTTTVTRTLLTLHQAGELDLTTWIEQRVSPKDFQKGTAYFQSSPQSKLKNAYEKLGLDYDTLRLCRLYVSKLSSSQEELKLAS